jgi:phasin family protein
MSSLFEQLSSIGKTNLEVAQKFASTSSELTERLIKAQMDAATKLLDRNNEQIQTLCSKPANAASAAYWQSVYKDNAEKAQEIMRHYFAVVTEIQTEMARQMTAQVTAINKDAAKNFGDLAKAALEEGKKAAQEVQTPGKRKRAT